MGGALLPEPGGGATVGRGAGLGAIAICLGAETIDT